MKPKQVKLYSTMSNVAQSSSKKSNADFILSKVDREVDQYRRLAYAKTHFLKTMVNPMLKILKNRAKEWGLPHSRSL